MKAMFYKEWLKTKLYIVIVSVILFGVVIYLTMRLHKYNGYEGEKFWDYLLIGRSMFIEFMEYIPLILSMLLAAVQFAPEMYRKSLKLTLHLPQSALKSTYSMLAYGSIIIAIWSIISVSILYFGTFSIFPIEFSNAIFLTATPWFLAAFAGYYTASWIILEPTWKLRIVYALITTQIITIYFQSATPGVYQRFLPTLLVFTPMLALLAPISIFRFKEGKQD